MSPETSMLAALQVPVYTTDCDGNITFFNEAAAAFWGHRPEVGSSRWCGSWRLFSPDGTPLAHEDCPMAVTLREGRSVVGVEAVAERPDGTRVPFLPHPSLVRNSSGEVTGAINLLVDLSDREGLDLQQERLAAIVSSSDDIIISKTLSGIITSWNAGATRILGFTAEEMIGQSITRIIPSDLLHEEDAIIAQMRRGERIEHFDTERLARDGRRVNLSLTVSPLRDRSGRIVGASKVARDITERKQGEELQRLLFDELNHRVKNMLATIQAIAAQSLRRANSPREFGQSFTGRIQALGRAHDLLVRGHMKGTDLTSLLQEQVVFGGTDGTRISLSGPLVKLEARVAVQLALVLHELATNARKYGALSVEGGALTIDWSLSSAEEPELRICWTEGGAPEPAPGATAGFGTMLIQRTMEASGGTAMIGYRQDGLFCEIRLKLGDAKYDTPAEAALIKFNEQVETRALRMQRDSASPDTV